MFKKLTALFFVLVVGMVPAEEASEYPSGYTVTGSLKASADVGFNYYITLKFHRQLN